MTVISTAGHVDHGKSTLVRALTGVDPDRWAEEKERGLTIDLGFASATLPSGKELSFIDVPGHERFIRNMLAGVGAVDACLFVVAATEGWKPQSEEHLRILELLGVQHGVIALTKVGIADDDLRDLAHMDVEEHVEGTFLEGAPIVPVDALDGQGVEDLRRALDELVAGLPTLTEGDRPRLWIDRVFAAKGAGTVVTGTLLGGRIRVDDELVAQPNGLKVRVRGLQSHHAERTKVKPGNRVAVNLSGVDHDQLSRGNVLVRPEQWHMTNRIDAELSVLAGLDHPVSRRGAHLAYIGSGEHPVRVRILGPNAITPGASGHIRLHLQSDLPLVMGDRFVLRESGRGETIGGGTIFDVAPIRPASKATPSNDIDRIIAERGWTTADDMQRLTGQKVEANLDRWVVAPELLSEEKTRLTAAVDEASDGLGLDMAGLTDQERAVVAALDGVAVQGGHAKLADIEDVLGEHPFLDRLAESPFMPPAPDESVDRAELRELVRRGLVIEEDGLFFAAGAIDEAARIVAYMLADQPEGFTVAELREELDTSRKYALPLLARLDGTGVTRRRENVRIAGPRLPDID